MSNRPIYFTSNHVIRNSKRGHPTLLYYPSKSLYTTINLDNRYNYPVVFGKLNAKIYAILDFGDLENDPESTDDYLDLDILERPQRPVVAVPTSKHICAFYARTNGKQYISNYVPFDQRAAILPFGIVLSYIAESKSITHSVSRGYIDELRSSEVLPDDADVLVLWSQLVDEYRDVAKPVDVEWLARSTMPKSYEYEFQGIESFVLPTIDEVIELPIAYLNNVDLSDGGHLESAMYNVLHGIQLVGEDDKLMVMITPDTGSQHVSMPSVMIPVNKHIHVNNLFSKGGYKSLTKPSAVRKSIRAFGLLHESIDEVIIYDNYLVVGIDSNGYVRLIIHDGRNVIRRVHELDINDIIAFLDVGKSDKFLCLNDLFE